MRMSKKEKEISFAAIIFIGALLAILTLISGCASSQNLKEDSHHYTAKYECQSCGHEIDINNINKNIRMKNFCPSCRKGFFYTPKMENVANSNNNYDQRPKIYGPSSSYYSDTRYQRFGVGGYSFKETPTGFSELSWRFHDSRVKRHSVYSRWRTTQRYHYP